MYLPEAFAERDPARLAAFLEAFPLGLLVATAAPAANTSAIPSAAVPPSATVAPFEPGADLVPFHYLPPARPDAQGGGGVLRAHIARANPLWRTANGTQVLVVFHGPQAYVTPSEYPAKAAHGRVVPTWNYAMVQARGTLRVVDDAEWLRAQVGTLTAVHEAGRPVPWSPDDAPGEYIDALLRAIAGIEIRLVALVGKWKLGQNRPVEDRRGVLEALRAEALGQRPDSGASGLRWLMDAMQAQLREAGSADD